MLALLDDEGPDLLRVPGPWKQGLQEFEGTTQRRLKAGDYPELGFIGNAGQ